MTTAKTSSGASPSSTGPAGSLFEGRVAAHYLLTMLAQGEPRGLPGTTISRVAPQGASDGFSLDDVILHCLTYAGTESTLQIQAKRTISFAPGDVVFKAVISQVAKAYQALDLSNVRHQFAVAAERSSFKMAGPYQDALRWAREISSSATFFKRLRGKGMASDSMRAFAETVRTHASSNGCTGDDETVWQILRRFQILTFDFDAVGSASAELAIERATQLIEPPDPSKGAQLWTSLVDRALQMATAAGDIERTKLLAELTQQYGFRLSGGSRNVEARRTLAEVADLAAKDLSGSIAGIRLGRVSNLEAVRAARDESRYIEIRGGPGVGKSGLLGLLVDEVLAEGRAIVLTPERTTPGGWLGFKSALAITGDPRTFLCELASDGGATLLIDSLDFFVDLSKRTTVIDLMRAAAGITSIQVIVTARTDFDEDDPSWLPPEIIKALGGEKTVVIGELAEDELEELRAGAPALRELLDDQHPAREVARNLFRLSRLLEVQDNSASVRSEIDLMDRWWTTADGPENGRRERRRLLADMTDAMLRGADRLEVRFESKPADALIASGSLREITHDNLTFRHEVLREWAMAARLWEEPAKLLSLPLTRSVPPSMARSIELGARYRLENSKDGAPWMSYLRELGANEAHASWRRWALLAILRSESSDALLDRVAAELTTDQGRLLAELIRTMMAADSRPLRDLLRERGQAALSGALAAFPSPINQSWQRLISWLLDNRATIPLQAIPDVVGLFHGFAVSMSFEGHPLLAQMAHASADWLEEIERARRHPPLGTEQPRFVEGFRFHELVQLANDVRSVFSILSLYAPQRAKLYLRSVADAENPDETIKMIVKYRGAFAAAAPTELVDVTLRGLIPAQDDLDKGPYSHRTFSFLDDGFLYASPAHGPFLEILLADAGEGLRLIRTLVARAIAFQPASEATELVLHWPNGTRRFAVKNSYFWSRNGRGGSAVQSALLALEAWGHVRIERGDDPSAVFEDLSGPDGSSMAFLLVTVDVLLSHLPRARSVLHFYLRSAQLLCFDKMRCDHDLLETAGAAASSRQVEEPDGPIKMAWLTRRLSRSISLDRVLSTYTHATDPEGDAIRQALQAEAASLGLIEASDTFAAPRFMARYALNVLDPANWPDNGSRTVYVAPPEERAHLEALAAGRKSYNDAFQLELQIADALDDVRVSVPGLVELALVHVESLGDVDDLPEESLTKLLNIRVSAAALAARDGSDETLDAHEEWARATIDGTLCEHLKDPIPKSGHGLRYSPMAIAALGQAHLWLRRPREGDLRRLLETSTAPAAATALGFAKALAAIKAKEPRLIPSLLRCAFVASIGPARHGYGVQEATSKVREALRVRLASTIDSELHWLEGDCAEPPWPEWPERSVSVRPPVRIRFGRADAIEDFEFDPPAKPEPTERVNTQVATSWLASLATSDVDRDHDLGWMEDFIQRYAGWTAAANGAGLEEHADVEGSPIEWNHAFCAILTGALPLLGTGRTAKLVSEAINVPDKSFFRIAPALLLGLDAAYFDSSVVDLPFALAMRKLFAERLSRTWGWKQECEKSELSVENTILPAISAAFFCQGGLGVPPWCYLKVKDIDFIHPFLDALLPLIREGPVPPVSMLVMNILEVDPRPAQLAFFIESALGWLSREPANTKIWLDLNSGSRMVVWLEALTRRDPELLKSGHSARAGIDDVLGRLVRVGVVQAAQLEKALSGP
jgi:hypothetical protein